MVNSKGSRAMFAYNFSQKRVRATRVVSLCQATPDASIDTLIDLVLWPLDLKVI